MGVFLLPTTSFAHGRDDKGGHQREGGGYNGKWGQCDDDRDWRDHHGGDDGFDRWSQETSEGRKHDGEKHDDRGKCRNDDEACGKRDKSGPQIRLHGRFDQPLKAGDALRIEVKAQDKSGVETISVRIDGAFAFEQNFDFSPPERKAEVDLEIDVPADLAHGSKIVLRVTAVDAVGNASESRPMKLRIVRKECLNRPHDQEVTGCDVLPSRTATQASTVTPTATPTEVDTPTATATQTQTATDTPTDTPTPTATPTSTATSTPTPTATEVPAPVCISSTLAGSGISDSSNGGSIAWLNPGNATICNSVLTTATVSRFMGGLTHQLIVSDYGFASIPDDAEILGITLTITRSRSGRGTATDSVVSLIDETGSIVGDNKAVPGIWPAAEMIAYGGPQDTWGHSWIGADVKSESFGWVLVADTTHDDAFTGAFNAFVNCAEVEICYQP